MVDIFLQHGLLIKWWFWTRAWFLPLTPGFFEVATNARNLNLGLTSMGVALPFKNWR